MRKFLATPQNDDDWHDLAGRLVRIHMTLRGWRFAELADALTRLGVPYDEIALRNRIARSRFSAALLLECMRAMGVDELALPTSDGDVDPSGSTHD